jgi:hypothetical protein
VWEFRFGGGEPQILTASRGAAYLHQLLSQPDNPIPAVRLAYNVIRDERLLAAGGGDEALDAQGLAVYRTAYEEYQEALEEARANNDPAAAEEAQRNINLLAAEMKRHQGLGRRKRQAGSQRERVRKAVDNALARVVREIAQYDRRFAEHLTAPRLTRGHRPCYRPGPDGLRWET